MFRILFRFQALLTKTAMQYLLFVLILIFSNPLEKAPDFDFIHESGEMQKLSDYDGSVVYIAFWASWCKPCLINFRNYEEMRLEMKKKGVTLLNVSLDKNKADWENALMSYGFMHGDNVHVSDIRNVMDLYELSYIPEYVILNKNREFVSLDQSEGRDVMADFDKWLEETPDF